jgi:predicted dehydrogenase
MDPTVLIIGCGSIGERHLRTFLSTGRCRVIACDTRAALREAMAERYRVETAADWRGAAARDDVTAAVVATPAPLHVPIARELLEQGRHALIEKPLALETTGIAELIAARDRAGVHTAVAYVCRAMPGLQAVRDWLARGDFGPVLLVTAQSGQHFPTYRPAYREIYYADPAQGGGAIQDALTHLVDAVQWLIGPTTSLACIAGHQALAGVTVEDTVAVAARAGDVIVNYVLNQFQAPNELTLSFHAAGGSVRYEGHHQRWGHQALGATAWTWTAVGPVERDAFFVAQAHAFLDGCAGRPCPLATLEDGLAAVRFVRAARRSAAEHLFIDPRAES